MVKFRNQVIHKGYLPSGDETNEYLKCAYEYISEQYKNLTSNDKIVVKAMIKDVMEKNNKKLDEIIGTDDVKRWTNSGPIIIHHGQLGDPNFKESLEVKIANLKRMSDAFRTGNVSL